VDNGTRGMTQRELILKLMEQVEEINRGLGKRPTRTEMISSIGLVTSILFGISLFLSG
jgi:hypothetical protein